QETHISQQRGSCTDEGTGSRPGVLDVSFDDSEEELSWNSSDDEEGDEQTKGREESEGDKTDESDDRSDNDNDDDNDETVKAGSKMTQNIEDSHVTLTLVHSDGPQESSYVSSFVTSMLNPISDAGVESIFTTASSPIVSLQTPTPIMTPSTIATITTSSYAPIPPTTIPSIILENLPTFNSAFCFDERLRSLETTFFEYRQTNPFVDAVSVIPADLSEMELKKILIEKLEGNKSIQRSDEQRNLYKVESAFTEEPVQTTCQMEEPTHPVFEIGADDQPIVQTSQHPEWFSQPRRPPSPDRDWNKTLPAAQGDAQSWISDLARQTDARSSFNELLDTPIDFSNFIMNRLGIATLTPELLAGLTYELMMGSCNSLTELEYHLEEVYKATTD
nr:hypothetical protein [Tanacetum cinerariifolium]GFB09073.1 hypothetical protein [Tanacetum cinerariifolium]